MHPSKSFHQLSSNRDRPRAVGGSSLFGELVYRRIAGLFAAEEGLWAPVRSSGNNRGLLLPGVDAILRIKIPLISLKPFVLVYDPENYG